MTEKQFDPKMLNALDLAFVGDGVYGLLVREPVEGDARLKRLVLTPIAQEQLSQMQQDLLRVENKATAALTKQELETLFTLLDKVRGSLAPGKEEPFID